MAQPVSAINPYLPRSAPGPAAGRERRRRPESRPLAVWVPGAEVPEAPGLPCAPAPAGAGDGHLVVVGAHGGAGASTLAALLGAVDGGGAWPLLGGGRARVLIAARTSVRGIEAAQRAAMQWARGDIDADLVGVAWMADAPGRLPRALRSRLSLVTGAFPESFRVPWVGAWRAGGPGTGPVPKAVARALAPLTEHEKNGEH
ncbi:MULTISPECIES: DUF6668 family protein [Actinomyces]|uniref:Uncharacterized protein n=3 Tax=Actinomyces marmotae TaxID=2737173 RepID=A0A6M8B114_9ACTO|nr:MULTISPECIES: DUF6668 family protein [Actinomyces]QKD79432.1 hypothetical protein HPC72_03455 [Actinomyces marmotae]